MHHIRKEIKDYLSVENTWNHKYKELSKAISRNHPWHLINAILNGKDCKKVYKKFILELSKFLKEPQVKKFLNIFDAEILKELECILNKSRPEIIRIFSFMAKINSAIKNIFLIFNPLDAYWGGYCFKLDNSGYIVVGPGALDKNCELIRHEVFHFFANKIKVPKDFLKNKNFDNLASFGYKTKKIITSEYIVRSLDFIYRESILKENIEKELALENKDFPEIKRVMLYIKKQRH